PQGHTTTKQMEGLMSVPRQATKELVAAHRQLIRKKVCVHYGAAPEDLREPFGDVGELNEAACVAAFLLKRDTKATGLEIARELGMPYSGETDLLVTIVERRMRDDHAFLERLSLIADDIRDDIDEKDLVWHRELADVTKNALIERIITIAL